MTDNNTNIASRYDAKRKAFDEGADAERQRIRTLAGLSLPCLVTLTGEEAAAVLDDFFKALDAR